jgi:prevent-host-death family protein
MQVNIREAKERLSQLIRTARSGEEVVIARRGQPVARLMPAGTLLATAGTGRARDILDWLDRHPLRANARRTPEEIDAAIEDERESWG